MGSGNKSILKMELEALIGSSKDQGQVGTGNSPKGVSEKRENEGGVLQSTKKQRKS